MQNSHKKLITDITEFALPDGQLYLSAIVDCFDEMVIGWKIGSRPKDDLVSIMLDETVWTVSLLTVSIGITANTH